MYSNETKMQIIDLLVTIVLFFLACLLGEFSMNRFGDTWIAFNVPVITSFAVFELLWLRVRKRIIRKLETKKHENEGK